MITFRQFARPMATALAALTLSLALIATTVSTPSAFSAANPTEYLA